MEWASNWEIIQEKWTKISNLGVNPKLTTWENRLIRSLNQGCALASLFLMCVVALNSIVDKGNEAILLSALGAIVYLIPIFLNANKYYVTAKLWFTGSFTSIVIIWCFYVYPTPYYLIIPFTTAILLASKLISRILSFPIFFGLFTWVKWDTGGRIFDTEAFLYDFYLISGIYVFIMFVQYMITYYASQVEELLEELNLKNEDLERQYALQKSEQFFRSLFETNQLGMLVLNKNKQLNKVNPAFCRMLGYTEVVMEAFSLSDLKVNSSLFNTNFEKLIQGDIHHFEFEGQFIKRDSTYADTIAHISGLYDEQGVFIEAIVTLQDVTIEKQLAAEKEERQAQQQQIFDSMPLGFMYLNTNNRVIRLNTLAAQFSDSTVKEMEGQFYIKAFKFITPEDLSLNQQVFEIQKPILGLVQEVQFEHKPNIWIRVDRIPIFDNQKKIIGLLKFTTDVTHLKNVQEEVEQKNVELQQYIDSNLQLENFAYIASHDMKEPLRTIHSFTQLLERRLKNHEDDRIGVYMNYITDGVLRMQNLIEDLLEYSRINQISSTEKKENIDLNETLVEIQENLKTTLTENKVELDVEHLPTLKVYSYQMIQLFQNLINNAIKFHRPDVIPTIYIKVREKADSYEFAIEDNGIGIAEEYLHKIFLIFKRLHHRKEYQGTGIGLATCKKITENHGGEIWVKSKIGEGSIFYFTLKK